MSGDFREGRSGTDFLSWRTTPKFVVGNDDVFLNKGQVTDDGAITDDTSTANSTASADRRTRADLDLSQNQHVIDDFRSDQGGFVSDPRVVADFEEIAIWHAGSAVAHTPTDFGAEETHEDVEPDCSLEIP